MSELVEAEGRDDSGEDDPLVVEWAAELADRIRSGEAVDWEELAARHPERAAALQRMLPAFDLMARLGGQVNREPARRDPIPDHATGELGCLGDYRLVREVGRGGMGVVYEGHQISLKRRVALKVLPFASAIDARQCQRFQIEAQAAAALHHANIVPVFAVGTERGVPFYAMQFIEGRSLAVVIRELRQLDGVEALGPAPACALTRSLIAGEFAPTPEVGTGVDCDGPTAEIAPFQPAGPTPVPSGSSARSRGFIRTVAALGLQAAEAIEHAHRHGILHRDIKPSNLLVDEAGHLWVTDFGLARVAGESNLTLTGDVLGTLRYMSPEQALGKRVPLDGRSDVYSLGVTLYELLTLRPAFGGDDRAEVLRRIAQEDPRPPRRINPSVPARFETIVLKAMAKEPARRYASAEALRDDLQRFLDNRPILARPVSAWGRAWTWARRRPAVAALLGVVVLMACGLVGGIAAWISWLAWHNRQLEVQVARADDQAREAARQTRIAEDRRWLADRHHYAESLRLARRALDAHQTELAQEILHDIRPGPDGFDPRDFAWRYLWREANRDFSQLWGHQGRLLGGAVAPDGCSVATADLSGKILVWDLAEAAGYDRPVAEATTRFPECNTTRFSSDGRFLAIGQVNFAGPAQGIHVFDRLLGRSSVQLELHAGESVSSLAFDDRRKLCVCVIGGPDGFSIRFYELANLTARPQARFLGPGSFTPYLSLDGRVVCVRNGGGVELSDSRTGRALVHLADAPAEPCWLAKFSPDGRYVAGWWGKRILVWETEGGRRIGHAPVETGVIALEWSRRGRFLAWGTEDGRLAILEPASGRARELLSGSRLGTQRLRDRGLSFSSDERLLAFSTGWVPGGPRPAEVWDLERGRKIWEFRGRNEGGSVCFVPGTHDVLVTASSGPRVCRLEAKAEPDALGGHSAEAWAAAFAPDGRVLATGSDDTDERQTIKLWDPASGKLRAGWKGHTATVAALAFSPDGHLLASGSLDSGQPGHPNLVLWDARSHQRGAILPGHSVGVRSVAFSPDGRLLASAGDDGTARLWAIAEKNTRAILEGHAANVNSIVFSPDGRLLATGSNDATVRLWDVATGRALATLSDDGNVFAVAFSPDGARLASVNQEGAIKLWDPSRGALLRTIRGDSELLRCLAFTPDSRNVVAAGKGRVVRIWDIATGQELLSLEGHQAQINALAFSSDGSVLVSCDHQGKVKLWRAEAAETVPAR